MDRAEALAYILAVANQADAVAGDADGVNWPETIKNALTWDELEHRREEKLVEAISVLTGLPRERISYEEATEPKVLSDEAIGRIADAAARAFAAGFAGSSSDKPGLTAYAMERDEIRRAIEAELL
jgi:hypothetical protein